MKTILHIPAFTFLLLAASSQCLAVMSVEEVSKERAKELGVEIRSKKVGASIYVWIEFKTKGELKNFHHAQLAIEGERSLSATLQPERPTPDSVIVFFAADPATLPNCTVTLVAKHGERELTGYWLRMKDLVEVEKPR